MLVLDPTTAKMPRWNVALLADNDVQVDMRSVEPQTCPSNVDGLRLHDTAATLVDRGLENIKYNVLAPFSLHPCGRVGFRLMIRNQFELRRGKRSEHPPARADPHMGYTLLLSSLCPGEPNDN